jgi:hypothetical protein
VSNLSKVKTMLCKFQDPKCKNFYFCPFTEEPMEEYGEKGVNIDSDWVEKKLFDKHIEAEMEKIKRKEMEKIKKTEMRNTNIGADFPDSRVKAAIVKDATKGLVDRAVRLIQDARVGNRHDTIYGQMWKLITIYHIDDDQISYIRSQIYDYEKIKEFDATVNYLRKKAA